MENVSEPDMPLENSDGGHSILILSTGEILFPTSPSTRTFWGSNNPYVSLASTCTLTFWGSNNPYVSLVNPSTLSLPSLNATSSSEPAPTLPVPALDRLGQIFSPPTNPPPLLLSTPHLGPILYSESPIEMISPLDVDDSNSSPRTMVFFRPEQSPFADPESPLRMSEMYSEDEDGGVDEITDDELGFEAEYESNAYSSDAGDSTNLSLLSLSSPNLSADSSPTTDTFNPHACNLPDCGIDFSHNIGPYFYQGSLPDIFCEPHPWGESRPPPGVFMAHWLTTILHKPTSWRDYSISRQRYCESPMERENRDLVANFMAHHGWWGETFVDETANFEHWDEYRDWINFCAWREERRAGLA
ncbi:hypothetical protein MMC29_000964 [Sticta canariensis]|nr:hypothetical protein [Sticta canariensis]